MKISNIRQDSVNNILATTEDGKTIAIFNPDDSEVAIHQLEAIRTERTIEAIESQGMKFVERA